MPRHELRHFVVGDPRQRKRVGRRPDVFDRRIRRRQTLDVAVAGRIHRAEPRVKVEERRHDALLILQPHLRRRDLLSRLVVTRRHDVIEDVDFHSGSRAGSAKRTR